MLSAKFCVSAIRFICGRMQIGLLAIALNLTALTYVGAGQPPADEPIRGIWVASVKSGDLFSPSAIDALVQRCEDLGFNTLCPVTWNRGVTLYPSPLMERTFGVKVDPRLDDFDPLRYLIQSAHAKNIRVFAWFEFGFSCSYGETDGGPMMRKKPHWSAIGADGKLVSKNNFQWMNAFHPEVQQFMTDLVMEVVANYDIDGIQGDDRLPANPVEAGYDDWTKHQYAAEHDGRDPPQDASDAHWIEWRAARLNAYARQLYARIKAAKPNVLVCAAPSVYPWSKQNYLQDWPTWVREGYVDIVSPQLYRSNLDAYRRELDKLLNQVPAALQGRVYPGVLVQTADGYRTKDDFIRQMIDANRDRNFRGEIIFYHAALRDHADVFADVYKGESASQE